LRLYCRFCVRVINVTMGFDGSHDLSVMSLNLRFGLADDGPNSWPYRSVAYADLFDRHPCDFYAFQEANDFQINFLNDLLGDYQFIGQHRPAPHYWQNNVTFFHKNWRCLSHQHFFLSDTPEVVSQFSRSRWPRQCTVGTFIRNDRRLTVVNTHFDFEAEVQRRSAQLICKRLDRLAPNWPVVLMGDLNADAQSSCMTFFTTYGEGGFKSALESPDIGTHHGFNGCPRGEAIDWILYNGAIRVVKTQVVTGKYCGFFPSDHFPLTAAFCWREQRVA
jgi:endonuclease/exonuclease/phosphatase family metal-dependent hydrolase